LEEVNAMSKQKQVFLKGVLGKTEVSRVWTPYKLVPVSWWSFSLELFGRRLGQWNIKTLVGACEDHHTLDVCSKCLSRASSSPPPFCCLPKRLTFMSCTRDSCAL
jgi:hypothetical protein